MTPTIITPAHNSINSVKGCKRNRLCNGHRLVDFLLIGLAATLWRVVLRFFRFTLYFRLCRLNYSIGNNKNKVLNQIHLAYIKNPSSLVYTILSGAETSDVNTGAIGVVGVKVSSVRVNVSQHITD